MIEHYFPPLHGPVDCDRCERVRTCPAAHGADRARRELTCKAGRCPRMPDAHGEVDVEEFVHYQAAFPLVRARNINYRDNAIRVEIHMPGERKWRRLHWDAPDGCWYFVEQQTGRRRRHEVRLEDGLDGPTMAKVMRYSLDRQFRAEVKGFFAGPRK